VDERILTFVPPKGFAARSPDGLRLAYGVGYFCICLTRPAEEVFLVRILLPEMSPEYGLSPPRFDFGFDFGIRKIDFWLAAGLSPFVF